MATTTSKKTVKPAKDEDVKISVETVDEDIIDLATERAKKGFSLADRIHNGIKIQTTKFALILDPNLAKQYNDARKAAEEELDSYNATMQLRDSKKAESSKDAFEVYENLANKAEAKVEAAEAERDALKEELVKSILTIHLRSIPNVAVRVNIRKAKKKFLDPETGRIDKNLEEEHETYLTILNASQMVIDVVDSDGEHGGPQDFDDIKALYEELPFGGWQLFDREIQSLLLSTDIVKRAVDDSGF